MLPNTGCPSINQQKIAQSEFWNKDGIHWDAHRIGWAVSGGCAVLTTLITLFNVMSHAMNYRVPAQQKQVIRILYMPPIFAIIAFFSYRFFRQYTYYAVSETLYEAIVVGAFMFYLIESVAYTTPDGTSEAALLKKDKSKLPFPLCCWRYRPTKAYFIYSIKWSVMQYTIFQPAVSIISVVTQAFNLLCSTSFSPQFANLYLTIVSTISNTVAVYGLVVFYELTKKDLKGRRPGAKFWCVQVIVTIPFFQQLLFSILQAAGVVTATKFWTATNVADGLNAIATSVEMVFFSLFMCWAFPITEYDLDLPKKHPFRALWDSINFWDFVVETWRSMKFFVDYALNKPGTRTPSDKPRGGGYKGRVMFGDVFAIKNMGEKWGRMSKLGLTGWRSKRNTAGDTSTIMTILTTSDTIDDPAPLGQDNEHELLTAGLPPSDDEKWSSNEAGESV